MKFKSSLRRLIAQHMSFFLKLIKAAVCPVRRKFELSWYCILFQARTDRFFPVGAVPGSHTELVCLCAMSLYIGCLEISCCYLIFIPKYSR